MKLCNVAKKFGEKIVFENLSIELPDRRITAVLGASGIGKTTLLNVLSGNTDFSGTVDPRIENVSYLFQEQRLLPRLTVEKNLAYVLSSRVKNKEERVRKIAEMLRKVGLSGEEKRYPDELSGGMGRRLSMARAFLIDADLLLMDEPFKELDVSLKKRMYALFRDLYAEKPRTTVFATHDPDEAARLADKAVVLEAGGAIRYERTFSSPPDRRTEDEIAEIRSEIYSLL